MTRKLSTPPPSKHLLMSPEERSLLAHLLGKQRDAFAGMIAACEAAAKLLVTTERLLIDRDHSARMMTDGEHMACIRQANELLRDRLTALAPEMLSPLTPERPTTRADAQRRFIPDTDR